MAQSGPKTIASLEKALKILESVSGEPRELKIVDLVQLTGFSRSSVQRLTHTLTQINILESAKGTSLFSVGSRSTRPAYTFLSTHPLIEVAMPLLVNISDDLGVSCDLWLIDGFDIISATRVPSLTSSVPLESTGKRVDSFGSVLNQLVYANLANEEKEKWAAHFHDQINKTNSIDGPTVNAIIKKGYHYGIDAQNKGQATWAAVVFDYSNRPIAVLSLSQFTQFTDEKLIASIGNQLAQCANSLSDMRIQLIRDRRTLRTDQIAPIDSTVVQDDPLFIDAVARGFDLLDCFTSIAPSLTLTDIKQRTGFSVPMVQRLTNTLVLAGYLKRNDAQKTFYLSIKCLDLLYGFQSKYQLLKSIWPRLMDIRKITGLRCSFCVLENENITHLLHIQGSSHVDYRTAFVGRNLPALSTSGGLAILSTKSGDYLNLFIKEANIQQITPKTITDKEKILKQLAEISRDGFALTNEQSILNEVNVAIPIQNYNGEVLGSIVISAPKHDWNYERLIEEVVPHLVSLKQINF